MSKKEKVREENQLYISRVSVWKKLFRDNEISERYKYRAAKIRMISRLFVPLKFLQRLIYDRKIKKVDLEKNPPVFILGHWRSGTTHLHYVFAEDPRLGVLSNFQCFVFNIALITRTFLKPVTGWVMPEKRPQDNVKVTPDKPGEEEQPLCTISTCSGFHSFFVPKNRSYFEKFNLFKGISEKERKEFKRKYIYVLKSIALYNNDKPLLLKNPHNTSRVKELLEMFPDAKFIFLHRDPYDVYNSTVRLYEKGVPTQVLQDITPEDVEEEVMYHFTETLKKYLDERHLIPKKNLVEVSFKELEDRPMEVIENIYNSINLPGFNNAKGPIKKYLDSVSDYQKNRFADMPNRLVKRINSEWDFFFKAFNYKKRETKPEEVSQG